MNFSINTSALSKIQTDLLVVQLFEGENKFEPKTRELDAALDGLITEVVRYGDFTGKSGQTLLLFTAGKVAARRVLLVGLGKRASYDLEKHRSAIAASATAIQKYRIKNLAVASTIVLPKRANMETAIQNLMECLLLGGYRFEEYKKIEPEDQTWPIESIQLLPAKAGDRGAIIKGAARGRILAEAVAYARDLGNHPSNVATPAHLAKHAVELGKQYPKLLKARVFGRAEIKKEKMGALLAVAQGSQEEPKFIILEYSGKRNAPTVALVGKGITFDSGGISIKPSDKMEDMKFDMAGAATVLGIIKAACELRLPINLIALIPATENLPSGTAIKPGDIVRSRSGKTIEIANTDAEGRLVLADALDYAKQYNPSLVIDFATLTGAIVAALGDDIAGAFVNSDNLVPKLHAAAAATGEKIWPMPLEPEYDQFIKSDFADLRNIGTVRFADAINAANFLKNFVTAPWIHLDIAGVAWATREKPYRPKGATGTGIRLAIEFLKNYKK